MNPYLTAESAAFVGLILVKSPQAATEKAYQNKTEALLNRYELTDKTLDNSQKPDALPPALIARGHQFLSDALALSSDYEKAQPPKKNSALSSQFSGSDFPLSNACTFHILSATRVQIVPRDELMSAFEARLEEGQWRIDVGSLVDDSPDDLPPPKTLTPQAAAFIKAVGAGDVAVVGQILKTTPTLANTPPARLKSHSEEVSDFPLSIASFHHDVPMMTLLLQAGAKVNAENESKETALDAAAFFGGKNSLVLLLAHGAAIDHRDNVGETALYRAMEVDSADVVAVLLAHGADANARNNEGKTPLAVVLDPSDHGLNSAAIIKLLRQHGAKK